eukprot:3090102-Rhodomonas_salina.1
MCCLPVAKTFDGTGDGGRREDSSSRRLGKHCLSSAAPGEPGPGMSVPRVSPHRGARLDGHAEIKCTAAPTVEPHPSRWNKTEW